MSRKVNVEYTEPADYFPKEIRKKYKLGEYNDEENVAEKRGKETSKWVLGGDGITNVKTPPAVIEFVKQLNAQLAKEESEKDPE